MIMHAIVRNRLSAALQPMHSHYNRLAAFCLLSWLSIALTASAGGLIGDQIPDQISYDAINRTAFVDVYSSPFPLESYPWPSGSPPKLFAEPFTTSSTCWRGHVAFWEIKEDRLYLVGIKAYIQNVATWHIGPISGDEHHHKPARIAELFPGKLGKEGVFADWYSGTLSIYDKKLWIEIDVVKGEIGEVRKRSRPPHSIMGPHGGPTNSEGLSVRGGTQESPPRK